MDNSEANLKLSNSKPRTFKMWPFFILLLVVLIGVCAYLLLDEFRSSRLQARYFAHVAHGATFQLQPGPSKAIRFPGKNAGPYDLRMGYAGMPVFQQRLTARGYAVTQQAVPSQGMQDLTDHGLTLPVLSLGLFPPYREKDQAGLTIYDGYGQPLYQSRYPQRVYAGFDNLPPLLISGLLYIENHSLLDEGNASRNPAVEWGRLSKALADKAIHLLNTGYRTPGASTLATQIEKYRHSPDGRTDSEKEKLRQMLSASVRAYMNGEDTTLSRRQLVLAYLNTVPLAARAGFGEISGIGDGMWAWYGRSFDQVNHALDASSPVGQQERATVFKEALSLMISQRSPSWYLNGDMKVLEGLTDSYLRLMAKDNVISPQLRDAALKVSLRQQKERVRLPAVQPIKQKGANAVRVKLAGLLGVSRMYDLDHLDLVANSTLDSRLQQEVTDELVKLRDPDNARAANLVDQNLLQQGAPEGVTYSFTLIERTPGGNKVRVQADNFDQPFDINEGAKLDLGSTSKLRTLVTYLQIVSDLQRMYGDKSNEELAKIKPYEREPIIRRWAIDYLRQNSDHSLPAMLEASLERKYSASPGESFFTGGGLHTFNNFDKEDNYRILTVREATRRSVNLVYIRLMRDVVHYYMNPPSTADDQAVDEDGQRQEYLKRFADREGRTFLAGFYNKYRGKSLEESEALLIERARQSPKRLAVIYRSILPQAGLDEFSAFVSHNTTAAKPDQATLAKLYDQYGPDRFSLTDRGYLASVHPLELWLVAYLHEHPKAGWSELVKASIGQRQEVYTWLFNSRHKGGQSSRINQIREVDAFAQILKVWKKVGYPFDSLVPSYATALGASADRPAALAELMGILVNDGKRLPTVYLDKLHFAASTPYDTTLQQAPAQGEQVLPPEIPHLVRKVLSEVVEQGTARRVSGAFDLDNGTHILVGGKTGTGDNRYKTFAKGGALLTERVVSRSGAFAFYIGDRYFGTLIAYVAGPQAADYKFTSALPVQILKVLSPVLKHRLALEPSVLQAEMPVPVKARLAATDSTATVTPVIKPKPKPAASKPAEKAAEKPVIKPDIPLEETPAASAAG
ncbi:transglycosylase domain-containing protein [Vogesella sp. LIG4]|uniref:transglycosylase domain-containing protein n=1 Tax=Vogesella sp. LIG4 TaxID=1192162 RepID=UPI00081F8728|nr:transglycosylase domain-containing protein [Vogesella sp. LIG4]SCK18671.1 Membrane carboxypeptidase (penicillin-binding protein) [Vogesella sp. LIG4]